MLKILPKTLSGISQKFHVFYCALQLVFPCIMLALLSWLATFPWKILVSECPIRVFHYKVTVLLEGIHLMKLCTMHLGAVSTA